jgi:hypothetical protein
VSQLLQALFWQHYLFKECCTEVPASKLQPRMEQPEALHKRLSEEDN